MSFPRERDPGTGTKNEVVTNWQHSVMRIQVNKNPSMTAQQLHNKCVSLQNLSIRTIQRCLTVLLHKKHRFLLFGAYCIWKLNMSYDCNISNTYDISMRFWKYFKYSEILNTLDFTESQHSRSGRSSYLGN